MKRLSDNIFSSFTNHSKDLSVYRIIFCLYILLFPGLPSFAWIGEHLNFYFVPPKISIAGLFSGFPDRGFFITLTVVNICSFFLMFWGLWTKWSSIVFSCSILLGSNFQFSFGKIDHTVLHFYVPLFMAALGWGEFYSIDNWLQKGKTTAKRILNPDTRTFILALFALLIAFAFFTAGIHKLKGGWWKWDSMGTQYWLHRYYFGFNRTEYLSGFFVGIQNHFFWKMQDYLVLLFEIGFIFSAINIKLFRFFLGIALLFHAMVLLTLNITFSGNIITYLAFVEWGRIRTSLARMIPVRHAVLILRTVFVLSSIFFLLWIGRIFGAPDAVFHLSLTKLLFEYLSLPTLSELVVCVLVIPMMLFLLFLYFRKTAEVPDLLPKKGRIIFPQRQKEKIG